MTLSAKDVNELPLRQIKMSTENLDHEGLIVENLLQIMEEKYTELQKHELDAIIMLIIETNINQ